MAVDRTDSTRSAISSSLKAAAQAEKDARDRIQQAHKRTEQAQVESDTRVGQIRDEYVRRSEAESERQNTAIESQRGKGYEHLRELQRAHSTQEARIRREGESGTTKVAEHYRDATHNAEVQGKNKLSEIELSTAVQQDVATRRLDDQVAVAEAAYRTRMDDVKSTHEQRLETAQKQGESEYAQSTQNQELTREAVRTKFEADYAGLVEKNKKVLDSIDSRASRMIREIRQDTSAKLSAYASRQEDPFYKMLSIDSKIDETDHAYILTARIPEHERESVSVTVRGDQLVVGVRRRNEEKLETAPGKTTTSSSYQTLSETFPLQAPVNSTLLTKEYDGDFLMVTVPKKSLGSQAPRHVAAAPERARVERPHFPDNLPLEEHRQKDQAGKTLS